MEFGDTSTLYRGHRGIGAILGEYYQNENRYPLDSSIHHLNIAGDLALAMGDHSTASGVMCIIGEYLMEYDRSLSEVESYFTQATLAYAYQKMGYFNTQAGHASKADGYFNQSLDIYKKISSKDGMLNTWSFSRGY